MPIIRSSRLYFCYCRIWLQSHNFPHPGHIACCSARNSRPPATKALHTICGNNRSTVSSSWWWTYKCPKHVEQIISAIKHSVASSWFSLYAYTTIYTVKHTSKTRSLCSVVTKVCDFSTASEVSALNLPRNKANSMISVEAFQHVSTPALLPKFRVLPLRSRSLNTGVTTVTETINDRKYEVCQYTRI